MSREDRKVILNELLDPANGDLTSLFNLTVDEGLNIIAGIANQNGVTPNDSAKNKWIASLERGCDFAHQRLLPYADEGDFIGLYYKTEVLPELELENSVIEAFFPERQLTEQQTVANRVALEAMYKVAKQSLGL